MEYSIVLYIHSCNLKRIQFQQRSISYSCKQSYISKFFHKKQKTQLIPLYFTKFKQTQPQLLHKHSPKFPEQYHNIQQIQPKTHNIPNSPKPNKYIILTNQFLITYNLLQFQFSTGTDMTAKLGQDIINFYKPYRNYDADWKTTVIAKQKFEIYGRYEIIDVIGQGAYGIVVAAKDKLATDKSKELVAIKKIDKAFQHKIFAKRTLRQLRLLKLLKHENIINIETIILPKSRQQFQDVYVVSEMMDTDLTSIIKSQQPLTEQHYKFFLYQLLRGLKYIHSAKIVHRDLKPRNLLVNSNCDLKICDFGLARPLFKNVKANVLTQYVATRWYRAPQLLLSANHYTTSVDMWSVGCIFAEMLQRKPFLPGTDTKNQIQLICQYLGTPEVQYIKNIPQESKKLIKSLPKNKKNGKDFSKLFSFAPPEAIDLLKKFLIFDPEKRITVEQALKHPYMADLHLQEDQPTRDQVDYLCFEFEDYNLTTQQFKDVLYQQILLYHNKQFYQQYQAKKKRKQSLISHILNNSNKSFIDPYADNDD